MKAVLQKPPKETSLKYSLITNSKDLSLIVDGWGVSGISSVAMDFEEESNLHCYGEHLCTMQLYDGTSFYLVDCLELVKTQDGLATLKSFLEGPIEKVMFACQSDAALARKTLGIQLANVYDIRVLALALGITGTLSTLEEKYFPSSNSPSFASSSFENNCTAPESYIPVKFSSSASSKKRFQTANWMIRPIPESQILYALGDVKYLLELKDILWTQIKDTLPVSKQKAIIYGLKNCAKQKKPERPGWEKICNYKMLSREERIYVKHYFLARDALARKHNVPASYILPKQTIVAMTKAKTYKGFIAPSDRALEKAFAKAQEDISKELRRPVVS